jgi:hypothetical protein
MTPTPAHSLLVTLAYSALLIMALFLIFFVVVPALEELFERVDACTEHHTFVDCLLGFWASF